MKFIAPADLHTHLLAQPDATVLDVRTAVEYAELHVPQARNIPLNTLAPRALVEAGVLAAGQPAFLLCRSGTRAKLAGQQFLKDGLENAVVVEGGTQAWQEAGLPLARGEAQVAISLERQVRIAAGALVVTGLLLSRFVHPWFAGLSAFVGAGLIFAGVTDWCGMGLLLARLPWNTRAAA